MSHPKTQFVNGESPWKEPYIKHLHQEEPAPVYKKATGPIPMAYAIPGVIQNVVNLKVGEGIELPPTLRKPCNWSNQVNAKLEEMGFPVRVRQSTRAGITTLWRVS